MGIDYIHNIKKYFNILRARINLNYKITEEVRFSFLSTFILESTTMIISALVLIFLLHNNKFSNWNLLKIIALIFITNASMEFEVINYDMDYRPFFSGEILNNYIKPLPIIFQLAINFVSYREIMLFFIFSFGAFVLWFYYSFFIIHLSIIIAIFNYLLAIIAIIVGSLIYITWNVLITSINLIISQELGSLYALNRIARGAGQIPFEKIRGGIKYIILFSGNGLQSVIATLIMFNDPYKIYLVYSIVFYIFFLAITLKLWDIALKRFEAYNY